MRLYEIQWIGPPRVGGPEIINRATDSASDDDAVRQHTRHLFATVYNPGAFGIRVLDSEGREVHLWAPGDDARTSSPPWFATDGLSPARPRKGDRASGVGEERASAPLRVTPSNALLHAVVKRSRTHHRGDNSPPEMSAGACRF
jgi:hypothetical protein